MKFCPGHWAKLREAIDASGLASLVAESGEQAVSNMASELDHGATIDNFDPLMGAHNYIFGNAMNSIRDTYQQNSLMLMADDAEHPEWACPICALNWCHAEHDRLCTQEGCNFPKGYDWTEEAISMSVKAMQQEWERLAS